MEQPQWRRRRLGLIGVALVGVLGLECASGLSGRADTVGVARLLDLSGPHAVERVTWDVRAPAEEPAEYVEFSLPDEHAERLAHASAHVTRKEGEGPERAGVETQVGGTSWVRVNLPGGLKPEEEARVEVNMTYMGAIKPYPEEVEQEEQQHMLWQGLLHFQVAEGVPAEQVLVMLPSSEVHSHTQAEPHEKSGQRIAYGPFQSVPGLSQQELEVHFPSSVLYVVASRLRRSVSLPPWGDPLVTEEMEMRNDGPAVRGGFSRLDLERQKGGAPNLAALQAALPLGATEVDLRDDLGKITSLRISRSRNDALVALLKPRFPLVRGWRAKLVLSYRLPRASLLASNGANSRVRFPAMPPVSSLTGAEEFEAEVVLPEGSTSVEVRSSFRANVGEGRRREFFNIIPRPVRVVKRDKLVPPDGHATLEVLFRRSSLPYVSFAAVSFASVCLPLAVILGLASISTPPFWSLGQSAGRSSSKLQ